MLSVEQYRRGSKNMNSALTGWPHEIWEQYLTKLKYASISWAYFDQVSKWYLFLVCRCTCKVQSLPYHILVHLRNHHSHIHNLPWGEGVCSYFSILLYIPVSFDLVFPFCSHTFHLFGVVFPTFGAVFPTLGMVFPFASRVFSSGFSSPLVSKIAGILSLGLNHINHS